MKKRYLGDGLYARYDGCEICLMANSETEPSDMVYLDPKVWEALKEFVEDYSKSDPVEEE